MLTEIPNLPKNEPAVKITLVAAINHANADEEDCLIDGLQVLSSSNFLTAAAAIVDDHNDTESEHSSWCEIAMCITKHNFTKL